MCWLHVTKVWLLRCKTFVSYFDLEKRKKNIQEKTCVHRASLCAPPRGCAPQFEKHWRKPCLVLNFLCKQQFLSILRREVAKCTVGRWLFSCSLTEWNDLCQWNTDCAARKQTTDNSFKETAFWHVWHIKPDSNQPFPVGNFCSPSSANQKHTHTHTLQSCSPKLHLLCWLKHYCYSFRFMDTLLWNSLKMHLKYKHRC